MLKGFKEVIMRGNVLELAVGIGGANVNGLTFHIVQGNDKSIIDVGAIINAAIVFVLTAAVVYFVLDVPMLKIQSRRTRAADKDTEPEPLTTEQDLLVEIRDAPRFSKPTRTPGVDQNRSAFMGSQSPPWTRNSVAISCGAAGPRGGYARHPRTSSPLRPTTAGRRRGSARAAPARRRTGSSWLQGYRSTA
jgi:large conductance mechanosensitive channel